jgi:hypothetical protein
MDTAPPNQPCILQYSFSSSKQGLNTLTFAGAVQKDSCMLSSRDESSCPLNHEVLSYDGR